MKLNAYFQWGSLKTRVTLVTLAIFLIGIWSMSIYASHMLREEMQGRMGDQQFSTVSLLADEIDKKLDERLRGLESVAASLDSSLLANPKALQAQLELRPILSHMFNGGAVVMRADGTAIAEVPLSAGRIGVNYMDIDTIAAALKEGKSTIGRPVMGKKLIAPVFGMATPIRDTRGTVIGALSGVVNLGVPNFLDKIVQNPYGKTGGYVLIIPGDRLIVTATDRTRIMQPLPAPGINPMIDRFLQGYEGSAVYSNALGVEVLGAAKVMPQSGWLLGAILPTAEAFAPIRTLQQRMLVVTLVLTLLTGGLSWWMVRRALSPLLDTAGRLAAMSDPRQPLLPLPSKGQDEVTQLIGGFNRLLDSLAHREATLRESEARYRSFFESSQDAIFVHRDNKIIFANDRLAELFHADSAVAMLGRDWHELIVPEDWPTTERRVTAITRGEAYNLPPLEQRHVTFDGQVITMESTGTRIIFDGQPAVLSVYRDISERKRAEEQRLAEARQQRDTLVREVHHRIKNNLQSVAGLLQRELGKFIELDPRLEAAISQVHAIAVVHGLQSVNPDETIGLCDSVCSICKSVADLSQRQVLFSVEHEQTAMPPLRLDNSEAVSMALVLNELILNAVKHSPPDSASPTVSLSDDGRDAQLVIRNALASPPQLDMETGEGLGTGLRLVRSLLPHEGVQLSHELAAGNFLLTRLRLTAPVVMRLEPRQ